jgi:hypothetical protein
MDADAVRARIRATLARGPHAGVDEVHVLARSGAGAITPGDLLSAAPA